jgi:hypothetical protein
MTEGSSRRYWLSTIPTLWGDRQFPLIGVDWIHETMVGDAD